MRYAPHISAPKIDKTTLNFVQIEGILPRIEHFVRVLDICCTDTIICIQQCYSIVKSHGGGLPTQRLPSNLTTQILLAYSPTNNPVSQQN